MALPDSFRIQYGTPIIWGEDNATGGLGDVTHTLDADALASGSARGGDYADLGADWDQKYGLQIAWETGTAPTAGGLIDVALGWSRISTKFPGGLSGTAGAWPADGNEDEWMKQLGFTYSLPVTNDGNTEQISNVFPVYPKGRYVVAVVDNNTDQAGRDQATASNNLFRIVLAPWEYFVKD